MQQEKAELESKCKELEAQLEAKEAKSSRDGEKATKEKKQIEKLSSTLTEHVVCRLPRFLPPLFRSDHLCLIG